MDAINSEMVSLKVPPDCICGSMARKNCPLSIGCPSSSMKEPCCVPSFAPVSALQRTSTRSPILNPLTPPAGTIEPVNPCSGSLVGLPSASRAQPKGIDSPCSIALFNVVQETSVVDWSTRNATSPSGAGTAKEIGLVPMTGMFPPGGATTGATLVAPNASKPARAR